MNGNVADPYCLGSSYPANALLYCPEGHFNENTEILFWQKCLQVFQAEETVDTAYSRFHNLVQFLFVSQCHTQQTAKLNIGQ